MNTAEDHLSSPMFSFEVKNMQWEIENLEVEARKYGYTTLSLFVVNVVILILLSVLLLSQLSHGIGYSSIPLLLFTLGFTVIIGISIYLLMKSLSEGTKRDSVYLPAVLNESLYSNGLVRYSQKKMDNLMKIRTDKYERNQQFSRTMKVSCALTGVATVAYTAFLSLRFFL